MRNRNVVHGLLVCSCLTASGFNTLGQQNPENSDLVVKALPPAVPLKGSGVDSLVDALLHAKKDGSILDSKSACPGDFDVSRPLIVHRGEWIVQDDGTYTLKSSRWFVYRLLAVSTSACALKGIIQKSTGQPMLYGDKSASFIGINHFSASIYPSQILIGYKVSAAQAKAANIQNLSALLAVVGITLSTAQGVLPRPASLELLRSDTYVTADTLFGLSKLPFDFNISPTLKVVSTGPLPDATAGQPYKASLKVTGGTPLYTFSTPDPLPSGLTLTSAGVIQGTVDPNAKVGPYKFTVTVKDSSNPIGTFPPLTINVVSKSNASGPGGLALAAKPASSPGGGTPAAPGGSQQQTSQTSNPTSPVDCTSVSTTTNCSFTHTIHSYDREWWDFSLAMPTPGVRQPEYSASNPAAPPSSTLHTDLYGMLDLYPASRWATKDSAVPHVLAGLPVTGQPFYRPFFGLAENVTGWTGLQRRSFPLGMSVFFGFVDMRQQYAANNSNMAAGQPALVLKPERVWKPMFGIELSVSALVSKISGGSKGGGGGKTGNSQGGS